MRPTRIIWRTHNLPAGLAVVLLLAGGAPSLAQGVPGDGGSALPPAIEPLPEDETASPSDEERLRAIAARIEAERQARLDAERKAAATAPATTPTSTTPVPRPQASRPKPSGPPPKTVSQVFRSAPTFLPDPAAGQRAESPPQAPATAPILAPPGGAPVTVVLAAKPASTPDASLVAVGVGLFLALLILAGLALQRILEAMRPKAAVKVFADPGEADAPVFQRDGPALSFDLGRGEAVEEAAYPAGAA